MELGIPHTLIRWLRIVVMILIGLIKHGESITFVSGWIGNMKVISLVFFTKKITYLNRRRAEFVKVSNVSTWYRMEPGMQLSARSTHGRRDAYRV